MYSLILNNKIVSTKRTSSIFLAIVLVAGTIAAISPSSFIVGINAQSESYNYGMDDRYNSYEQDYGMDSYDKKPYGNSYKSDYDKDSYNKKPYEPKSYGNSYEPDYGMDVYKKP